MVLAVKFVGARVIEGLCMLASEGSIADIAHAIIVLDDQGVEASGAGVIPSN